VINFEEEKLNEILNSKRFNEISESDSIDYDDVVKILQKACGTFRGSLSQEEISTCCLNALWKAVDRYCIDTKCKFTTYLYKGVVMECLTQKKFNKEKISFGGRIHANIKDPKANYESIDMMDEIQFACEDPSLITDRFYKNMSIKEMAENRGVCGETIRIRINKNLKNLKHSLLKSV
tara:strand:- start:658 stop:1191 length:534 start_codon:yes stop_codon:yes gene_type:complete